MLACMDYRVSMHERALAVQWSADAAHALSVDLGHALVLMHSLARVLADRGMCTPALSHSVAAAATEAASVAGQRQPALLACTTAYYNTKHYLSHYNTPCLDHTPACEGVRQGWKHSDRCVRGGSPWGPVLSKPLVHVLQEWLHAVSEPACSMANHASGARP